MYIYIYIYIYIYVYMYTRMHLTSLVTLHLHLYLHVPYDCLYVYIYICCGNFKTHTYATALPCISLQNLSCRQPWKCETPKRARVTRILCYYNTWSIFHHVCAMYTTSTDLAMYDYSVPVHIRLESIRPTIAQVHSHFSFAARKDSHVIWCFL